VGGSTPNKCVIFVLDNKSVAHIINKQTAKHKDLLGLLRHVVLTGLH